MAYRQPDHCGRFWAWWWPSILAWCPAALRDRLHRPRCYRFLHWNGTRFEPPLTDEDTTSPGTVLLLPAHQALTRSLRLPASASAHLGEIARTEVERQTPFSADAAYFGMAATSPGADDAATFTATLVAVPKWALDNAEQAARASGVALAAVDVLDATGRPLGVNLLPVARRHRPPLRWQRWNIALGLVCLLAGFGCLAGLLQARQRAYADLASRFAPVQAQAAGVLRRERALQQADRLLHARIAPAAPTALELLSTLSARLPRDSHLLDLRLSEGTLALRGQTTDLDAVLRSLQDCPIWDSPRLTGSRTLPDGQAQEFSLTLQLKNASPVGTP